MLINVMIIRVSLQGLGLPFKSDLDNTDLQKVSEDHNVLMLPGWEELQQLVLNRMCTNEQ